MQSDNHHMLDSSIPTETVEGSAETDVTLVKGIRFPELPDEPILYNRRWFIVLLFAFYSASSAFQWIHLNIIGDKILLFYAPSLSTSASQQAIALDSLSMVYMLGYIIFMLPASWILDRYGLYTVGVVGTLLNCLGACIKCIAVDPNRFAVLMLGQCVCSVAQAFILGVPARLAAVWFGPNEVSTATAIGVFGNQIGCALGFLLPPLIVDSPPDCVAPLNASNYNIDNNNINNNINNNSININNINNNSINILTNTNHDTKHDTTIYCDDIDYLTYKLRVLLYTGALVTTILFLLVLFFFKKQPPTPPSRAQIVASLHHTGNKTTYTTYFSSLVRLIVNIPFLLLLITYGINVGCYYAISTLLNPIILFYFPNEHMRAGWIGVTVVLAGVVGSILSGVWLDRFKLFKMTTLVIYCLSCLGMLAFTFILLTSNIALVFVTAFFMGFFMTGYLPVGFEFAAEITFPESEGTSSGLLNVAAQVFGITFTLIVRLIPLTFYGNLFLFAALLIGSIVTTFIKADLKRQKAHERITNICVIQSITSSPDPTS